MSTEKNFGSFFRSKRKAISPTLREFCRRNGFDTGNISRLERGLVPPPQSRQLLESYAKALKVGEGTAEWDLFFELAAAETGRIPADVLEDQQRLPSLFRQLRAGAQGQGGWVKARHLESWADTLDARGTLPQLVRRLIRATGKDIKRIAFPAEEQTQRPGWDGIVEAGAGDDFVPEGTSGWEVGADKNPQKKAEEDFTKRTKDSLGLDKKKTTFVFVTPRKWQKKGEWCRAKTALGAWKEVRVYDSASLEEWLEQALAVDAWLAGRLGLKPEGVISFDDYWKNLQALTDPSLKPEVFLASREAQVKELNSWLDGPAGAQAIETRSPGEAIDFVAACSQDQLRADLFAARALIVEDRNAWRGVVASSEGGLLLVPHPSLSIEPELVAEAVRKGNRVLLPSSQPQRERIPTLQLTRAYRGDLEKALESSGIDRQRARKLAREAGGSLTVLKRLLGRYPGTTQPEWSKPQEASLLVPMLLAGSWNESSDGDQAAVGRIGNGSYSAIAEIAERWLKTPDSPLSRVGPRWSLVSRDDSWFLLASAIRPDDLRRFEEVALDVLAEDDPTFDLPPEKRWEASFRKKGLRYSPVLRNGLAETLALLGSRPKGHPDEHGFSSQVEQIVRKLLDGKEWLRWASLSYHLPLLAEAGPDAFIEAVERDLKRAQPALARVFGQEGDPLFTSMPHTGVLWALEVLSWNTDLLPRVTLILASLDEKMPKGKSGNTPSRSLLEIFMPWFPQTTVPVEERVKVLRMLMQQRPAAGWRLLLALLSSQMASATEIHRPSWRDWALSWSEEVTNAEFWHQTNTCAQLLVEGMGEDVGRWKALIKHLANLPEPVDREFLTRLSENADKPLDDETRRDISETIRESVALHRRYSEAKWALPEERLAELEGIQRRFEPKDAIRKIGWLFGLRWRVLERLEDNEERVEEVRQTAIRGILDQEGWQGVLRLIEAVEAPEEVGAVIAAIEFSECEAGILPGLLIAADEKAARFARGYIWGRFRKEGWDWVERLDTHDWSAEAIARVLVVLPFERKTWQYADLRGTAVSTWYWQHTPILTSGQDGEEAEFAIERFLEHKRASEALHVIRMALHHKHVFQPSLFMDVLQSWLDVEVPKAASDIQAVKYDIDLLFQELQKGVQQQDPRVDINRLAKLEWACLALLDGYPSSPTTLHRLLRDEPAFFVQVLGLCFRPKNQPPKDEEEFSEKENLAAQNAYRLLMDWEIVPGSRDGGTVDEKELLAWIKEARALAEKGDLLEICDSRIGQVFAHSPKEVDGSWPCIPVRDALEEIGIDATDAVFSGFSVGIYNKRGTFSKSLREGGAQERALAETYRGFADACKVDWPKTAATLRRVALGYDEDARREDTRVELDG